MSTNEDLEDKEAEGADEESEALASALSDEAPAEKDADEGEGGSPAPKAEARSNGDKTKAKDGDSDEAQPDEDKAAKEAVEALPAAPVQLGYRRFVYAAYFGFAIGIAFVASKLGNQGWYRLSQYKPQWDLGDPKDEIIMPIGAVIGGLAAVYYYRKQKSRQYVDDVASELSQVTWPNRKEVTNSTAVVIVTTIFATVFFALMDRFWGFVTNLVYGS